MVALLIAAAVILTTRHLLGQLTLSDRRQDDAIQRETRLRNGARFATEILGRLEVGTDSLRTFTGEPTRAVFTTWCAVPRGWLERCTASLEADTTGRTSQVYLLTSRGDSVVVLEGAVWASFRYLTDPEGHDTWVLQWGQGISAPLAIAIVTATDTTLIRIGPRG